MNTLPVSFLRTCFVAINKLLNVSSEIHNPSIKILVDDDIPKVDITPYNIMFMQLFDDSCNLLLPLCMVFQRILAFGTLQKGLEKGSLTNKGL